MADTNKNNARQEGNGEKQVSITHLIYLTIIFIILTILFWTLSLNSSDEALRLFSFASTITSIVLAVVSIVFSIFSGKNVDASLGSISKTSDDIRIVGHDIQKIGEDFSKVSVNMQSVAEGIETVNAQLNGEVEKISGLESNVNNILASNENLSERVSALLDELRNTHSDVKGLGEQIFKITKESSATSTNTSSGRGTNTYNKAHYTFAARLLLYACLFTQKEGYPKSFPLSILMSDSWELYFYGYAYSLKGLLGIKIFDAEVEDRKTITIKTFDTAYFKDIKKEGLFADVKESNRTYLEGRLVSIEQYFDEHKEDPKK